MNKEEFIRKSILQTIYEDIKDKFEMNTASHLRYYIEEHNIKLSNEEIRDLYVRITNYRIEKYGTSIIFKDFPKEHKYITYDDYTNIKRR